MKEVERGRRGVRGLVLLAAERQIGGAAGKAPRRRRRHRGRPRPLTTRPQRQARARRSPTQVPVVRLGAAVRLEVQEGGARFGALGCLHSRCCLSPAPAAAPLAHLPTSFQAPPSLSAPHPHRAQTTHPSHTRKATDTIPPEPSLGPLLPTNSSSAARGKESQTATRMPPRRGRSRAVAAAALLLAALAAAPAADALGCSNEPCKGHKCAAGQASLLSGGGACGSGTRVPAATRAARPSPQIGARAAVAHPLSLSSSTAPSLQTQPQPTNQQQVDCPCRIFSRPILLFFVSVSLVLFCVYDQRFG